MTSKDESIEDKPKGLRNVLYLGSVNFFTDFSTEMILGVLPNCLVNNLGVSKAILGAREGSSELTSYVFRMISISISDTVGKRKIFVLIGYGLSTISKPFFVVASSWYNVGFLWDNYDINVAVTYSISLSLSAIIGMIDIIDYLLNQ